MQKGMVVVIHKSSIMDSIDFLILHNILWYL